MVTRAAAASFFGRKIESMVWLTAVFHAIATVNDSAPAARVAGDKDISVCCALLFEFAFYPASPALMPPHTARRSARRANSPRAALPKAVPPKAVSPKAVSPKAALPKAVPPKAAPLKAVSPKAPPLKAASPKATSSKVTPPGGAQFNDTMSEEEPIAVPSEGAPIAASPPLNRTWALWARNVEAKDGDKIVAKFRTIGDMWRVMNYLPTDILRLENSVMYFQDGISPTWEDEANRSGGRWMYQLDGNTPSTVAAIAKAWEILCLEVFGEGISPNSNEVIGIVLNRREKYTRFSVWTRHALDAKETKMVGAGIRHFVTGAKLEYLRHNDNSYKSLYIA